MELKTIEFIKEYEENWRELLKDTPYCLTINENDNYAIFKYSQTDSDFNEQICKECRGLIIDKNTLKPVALSFYKFFNYGEQFADRIYWKDCKVQEKVDGSKMLVWYDAYENKWQISTSSQLNAYEAKVQDFNITFGQLFDKALINNNLTNNDFYNLLDKKFCYTFELVSPESRVVIPYKKADLYFIGVRNIETFEECNTLDFMDICNKIKIPKQYPLNNLKACLHATECMGYDEEGFVVVDNHFNRVKIKSPAYVSAHHLKNNSIVNQSRILNIIENGEQEEFLTYFPEYKDYFVNIENKLIEYKNNLKLAIEDINFKMEHNDTCLPWTRKDFANYINQTYPQYSSMLFKYMNMNLINLFIDNQWSKLSKEDKMKKLGLKYEQEEE